MQAKPKPRTHVARHLAECESWRLIRSVTAKGERQRAAFQRQTRPPDPTTGLGIAGGVRACGYG